MLFIALVDTVRTIVHDDFLYPCTVMSRETAAANRSDDGALWPTCSEPRDEADAGRWFHPAERPESTTNACRVECESDELLEQSFVGLHE